MLLWQLAAPTLIAIFLALVAIRGGVESSDAFSRFWDQAMAGRTEIAVVVDTEDGVVDLARHGGCGHADGKTGDALGVPVHIVAAGSSQRPGSYVIRLSLTEKPAGRETFRLGRAAVFRGAAHDAMVWVWAENAEALRSAAQILTSRSAFPEVK